MLKLITSCVILLHLALSEKKILLGHDIDISKVPYQVVIGNYELYWCGGAIIGKQWILTAAHCFKTALTSDFVVYAGVDKISELGKSLIMPVKRVTLHPNYNFDGYEYDIAVLELDDNLKFARNVRAVNLPNLDQEVPIGSYAYVTGWGLLSPAGPAPNHLQGVHVQLLPATKCINYRDDFMEDVMICAGSYYGGVDACQGDSGGPLVHGNIIYGVVSFGIGCGSPGFPGVYSNVPKLRDFIESVTGF